MIYDFKQNDPKCFINDKWFLIRSINKNYLNKYFKIKKFRKKFETIFICFMVHSVSSDKIKRFDGN